MSKTPIEFIEPGYDPTEHEYHPKGPSIRGCLTTIIAVIAAITLGMAGISYVAAHQPPPPTATARPSATSTLTRTPTSTGTVTPAPTATITPTPRPSATPTFIPPPTHAPLVITSTPNEYQVQAVITATPYGYINQDGHAPTPTPNAYNWLTQRAVTIKTQQAQIRRAQKAASMTATPGG